MRAKPPGAGAGNFDADPRRRELLPKEDESRDSYGKNCNPISSLISKIDLKYSRNLYFIVRKNFFIPFAHTRIKCRFHIHTVTSRDRVFREIERSLIPKSRV